MKRCVIVGIAWMAAMAAQGYTTSSYVQTGLVAHWDAIDNAGTGTHDANATVWKDLAGSYDLTLTSKGSWKDGSVLLCDGCAATYGAIGPTTYQTIEIVYRQTEPQAKSAGILFCSGQNYHMALARQNGKSFFFSGKTDKHINWDAMDGARRAVAAVYKSATENSVLSNVYACGTLATQVTNDGENWNAGDCKLMIGDRTTGTAYPFKGEVCAIRLYSQPLTEEELARNYKIDSVRYMGATPDDVLTITAVPYDVPVGVSPSYDGRDELAAGDALTLTAPSGEIVLASGMKAVCMGYKIYDAAGSVVAQGTDTSYDYVHPGAYRRFEWQFDVLCAVSVTGAGGVYSVTDDWVAYGEDFSFTVTPDEGKSLKSVINDFDAETWTSTAVTKQILGPMTFTVSYSQVYYVSPTGDDSLDGKTRANAKKTIAAAVSAASAGESIALMAGEYAQPSATVTLNKAVTVYGEEGADRTFINLSADVTVFSFKAADAVLRGITFKSDYKTQVGCPITVSAAARVEDCVIRDAYIVHTPVYTGGLRRCATSASSMSRVPAVIRPVSNSIIRRPWLRTAL